MGRGFSRFSQVLLFCVAGNSYALVSPGRFFPRVKEAPTPGPAKTASVKVKLIPHPKETPRKSNAAGVVEQLGSVRDRILDVEKSVIDSLRQEDQSRARAIRLKALLDLRRQERELAKKRSDELAKLVQDLEAKQVSLDRTIRGKERSVYLLLRQIERFSQLGNAPSPSHEREKTEGPRRRVTVALVERGAREIEALRVDVMDAEVLADKIRSEKDSLASLFNEIEGNESAIRFQAELEADVLKKRHQERLGQLERYHDLQRSQASLENLLKQFNARIELGRISEESLRVSEFSARKGRLGLPVLGEIISTFGKSMDPESKLLVLHKGLEIRAPQASPVRAVFPGSVAYSGTLPGYGLVAIIAHGSRYYTLMARVASLSVHEGDLVKEGDVIGMTGTSSEPVYFEVRDHNLAVDPLRWVARSNTL